MYESRDQFRFGGPVETADGGELDETTWQRSLDDAVARTERDLDAEAAKKQSPDDTAPGHDGAALYDMRRR